jgi:hypothetical protein
MQDDKCAPALLDKVQKKLNLLYKLIFLLLTLSVVLTITSFLVKPSRATNKLIGEDLAKYQQEIEVLKSKLKQVEDMQARPVGNASETHTMHEMRINFDARITRIEDLLQGDPVRSLSVPLLRRDLDNMSLRITEYQVAVREDFNRIYDVFKWAFGILLAVILGAFAYFQKKLDSISRSNGKE